MEETFAARVQTVDLVRLRTYLQNTGPLLKTNYFEWFFRNWTLGKHRHSRCINIIFVLFHVLYQLQNEWYQEQQYLYIHFMRTMLLP